MVGTPEVIESPSPQTQYVVVFEDDSETGYFYGIDSQNEAQPILDALHIYTAANVIDAEKQSVLEILWTEDG